MSCIRTISALTLQKTVMVVTVLFFAFFPVSADSDSLDAGCRKWRDSLVVYGVRCLDSGNAEDAGRYFAGAFRCGMRKDSMHYFLSELYLRKMVLDTALVFNMAVEKAGTFPKELWVVQRAKLYWLIGKKEAADSLLALHKRREKKGRYTFVSAFSLARTSLRLNPFTFVPQNFTLVPDDDIDDLGMFSLSCAYEGHLRKRKIPCKIQFSASSFTPAPGGHFHDELTDTLTQYVGLSAALGEAGKTPELNCGGRMGLHQDGRVHWYLNAGLNAPIGEKQLVSIAHNEKLGAGGEIDNAGTDFSWMFLARIGSLLGNGMFMIGHQYSRSAMFQNRFDSTGIYPPVPIGYIRMNAAELADTSKNRNVDYYKDTLSTSSPVIGWKFYWDSQPLMFFLKVPRHSLTASMRCGITRPLPFRASLSLNCFIQGIYYTEKMSWYSRVEKEVIPYLGEKIYDDFAIVFNSVDGRYYLVDQRTQLTFFPDKFQLLEYHQKVRMDAYIRISATLKKELGTFGEVYCRGALMKGFSSLSDDDPLVSFNRSWEIAAGWKKEVSLVK